MKMSYKQDGLLAIAGAIIVGLVALMGMQEIALGLSVLFLCALAGFMFLQANDEDAEKGVKKK